MEDATRKFSTIDSKTEMRESLSSVYNSLKEKGIVSPEVAYIKIISGGKIDKSLIVFANDFTLSAVKMIALSGGQAIKSLTMKGRAKEKE